MKRLSCLVIAIWAVGIAAPAIGEELTVMNASFEDHALSDGENTFNGVGLDHWTVEAGEQVGVWNLSDLADYPGGAPDGVNVAYSQGSGISQVLPDEVVEGKTYTLTVQVGNSPCCAFLGYGVQLVADGVVLAEDANYVPVPAADFETVFVSYISEPGDPSAGDPLEIRLLTLGPEVAFDEVRLSATTDAFPDWGLTDNTFDVGRQSASMAYDKARAVVVMFGGRDPDPLGDTWEFDGATWSQVVTATSPPARFWHSMVYDSNRQRIVLFGGGDPDNTIYFDDTWEFDGTNWQQISTPHSPPSMLVTTMAFDSGRNRTVLFGGTGPSGGYSDTWEYDGSDWTLINTPVSPPHSGLGAMAYDEARERTVLTLDNSTLHLETWEYDGSIWAEVTTATAPLSRWAHAIVFDASSQHMVLFGGYCPQFNSGATVDDTWEYDGSDWTRIVTPNNPGPIEQHAMAYDSAAGRVVLSFFDQTWAYTSPSIFTGGFDAGDFGDWIVFPPVP